MIILFTMVYLLFLYIDIIPILKNKEWKVFIIYSIIITTAYTCTVLSELGVKIPSPANPLKEMITSIVGK